MEPAAPVSTAIRAAARRRPRNPPSALSGLTLEVILPRPLMLRPVLLKHLNQPLLLLLGHLKPKVDLHLSLPTSNTPTGPRGPASSSALLWGPDENKGPPRRIRMLRIAACVLAISSLVRI